MLFLPVSSEKELRKTLIVSLQHVRSVFRVELEPRVDHTTFPPQIETFGMLISKSYLMIINQEERQLRDNLAQAIRVRGYQPPLRTSLKMDYLL